MKHTFKPIAAYNFLITTYTILTKPKSALYYQPEGPRISTEDSYIIQPQLTEIPLQLLGNPKLKLVSVYKSPDIALDTSDLDALQDISANAIITGDLNVKQQSWHSGSNNIVNIYNTLTVFKLKT